MTEQERNLIRDAMMFAVKDITGRVMREATVQSMIDDFKKAINYKHSCTELKTVKQGENLILDNRFDVEVITPESSVLIKHKDKDRLIWVDKQRLKRK